MELGIYNGNLYRRVDDSHIFGDELMDVLFRIRTDGRALAAVPINKDCATMLCSWLAMQELMKQLTDIGAVCTRCGIVARTSEMKDTECAPGIGCRGDSDMELLLELPQALRMAALSQVVTECEENFKRRGGTEE